ncbi:Aquaporin SIP2-1 [Triticum urartu]|uniref:Aquaporin SIP2-1 n=1 Tax=Triticum urartu TaxID=4572 RepID=M7YVH1_TRIUA|nr:Aquaporin SIP2-1 [Triticum urartu]
MAPAPAPASSGRIRPWLVVGDLVLAVLWVCAGALVKLAVYNVLGLGGRPEGEAAKVSLSVVYMFLFAWLESATGGASYNPLTAISGALASRGGIALYLFTVFVRVPAQLCYNGQAAIASGVKMPESEHDTSIIEVKLPTPLNTSGGNPRSADRMLAAIMCRNPLGGGILGGALGFAGPADGFSGGAIRSSMWEDGLAQEDDAVWRHGGVDGRETWHGRCNSTTLKMESWQAAAAASYPACVLVEECAGLVIGAVIGVMLMRFTFPKVGKGAALSIGVHHGALTEGLATLMVVMVSLTLKKKEQGFFVKTWIASIWKMTIHILSSDMTGGIMNPASAFAWAYARGDHTSFDHLLVYWLAPLQATLVAVWVVTFLTKPKKTKEQEADKNKNKKE